MQLDDETLPAYLVAIGALESAEGVSVEIPGDGNINYVRRARQTGDLDQAH